MKHVTLNVCISEFDSVNELQPSDQELVVAAFKAASNAYAPYSGFTVGAALRLENGVVITGNNQENAAYPSGLCAERVAMFYASSQYPGKTVETMAIVARANGKDLSGPATPCGSCRQVMIEYEQLQSRKIRMILATESGNGMIIEGMDNLLPLAFLAKHLR